LSKPLKIQIVEKARALIADEQNWCPRHLAEDVNGVSVSPTSASAVKRCGLGAVIAAAYQLTHDFDAADQLGHEALRPRYGASAVNPLYSLSITRTCSRAAYPATYGAGRAGEHGHICPVTICEQLRK
jgi:hypothetical protein